YASGYLGTGIGSVRSARLDLSSRGIDLQPSGFQGFLGRPLQIGLDEDRPMDLLHGIPLVPPVPDDVPGPLPVHGPALRVRDAIRFESAERDDRKVRGLLIRTLRATARRAIWGRADLGRQFLAHQMERREDPPKLVTPGIVGSRVGVAPIVPTLL